MAHCAPAIGPIVVSVPRSGTSRIVLCVGILCAVATASYTQAQQAPPGVSAGADLPGIFALSSAIPGTTEHQLEKRARQISTMLGDLEPLTSARLMLDVAADGTDTVTAVLQLEFAPGAQTSTELFQTVLALVQHVEPRVQGDEILITDRRGRIVFEKGRQVTSAETTASDTVADPARKHSSGRFVMGFGLLLGLAVGVCWWLLVTVGMFARRAVATSDSRWSFLSTVQPSPLKSFLSEQRPELLGAILAELDEHDAARLRRLLRRSGRMETVGPQRSMHPGISQALAACIREILLTER